MENFESPPPPFNPPPPPMISLPPQKPQKRGRGWMIAAIILVVLLLISLFGNFTQLVGNVMKEGRVSTTRRVGPKLEEVILEDNGAANKIAVVEVQGIITSQLHQGGYDIVELIRAQLARAAESSKVKAVILKVNSPGGEVLASDEISRAIEKFQTTHNKPVVVSMGSLAASGGYYVSAPCQWIVANDLTITGSIGVIMHGLNYRGLMDKIGLQTQVYKSGKFKDMMSGTRKPDEVTSEEHAMIQKLIDQTYTKFKGVVAAGRGKRLNVKWEDYADGRVLSGKEAFDLGFVDELGDFQVAVKRAKTLAKIQRANIVEFQQRVEFGDLFSIFGNAESRAPVIKVDLGIESPKIEAGQLYFLSPTVLH